jgi:hypothetical protein
MPLPPTLKRFRWALLLVVLGVPLTRFVPVGSALPPPSSPAPPPLPPARLELIRPGTVIDNAAPAGWTHLILKSQPRLTDNERRKVGDSTAALATMVFTATAAAVEAEDRGQGKQYRLARVGVGVGVNARGVDRIVSPETQQALGADLGFSARLVLAGVCDKQKEVRLVAASGTGAIMDTPAFMPRGQGHAAVILRYVFLVDPQTGRLDTLVWRIDRDSRGNYEGPVGLIEWLPPGKRVDAFMQADLREFHFGVPTERAFAILRIPDGQKQFAISETLRPFAGSAHLPVDAARYLDASLRQMIRTAP